MAITYKFIAGTTLSNNAAGISVGSISQAYTDLIAVIVSKDTRSNQGVDDLIVYLNDTAVNGWYTVANVNQGNYTSAFRGGAASFVLPLGSSGATGTFDTYVFHLLNYSSTNQPKSIICHGGTSYYNLRFAVGTKFDNAAISSITINGEQGLVAGSSLNIYGILKA